MSITVINGTVIGRGVVESRINLLYNNVPPPPSGTIMSTFTPILMNKRRFVYKLGADQLQTKLMIFKGKELSYIDNALIELWLNYEGSWKKYENYTSNKYGIAHIKHSTHKIPNIDCCLGLARVTINGIIYNSNLVRFNFIKTTQDSYLIDAGSNNQIINDRSSYYIFDSLNRIYIYKRM